MIVFVHHRKDGLSVLLPEFASEEILHMAFYAFLTDSIDIPGHVHEKLDLIFGWLDVADVQDPHLSDTLVVGELHLLPHQIGVERAEPKIVVRAATQYETW